MIRLHRQSKGNLLDYSKVYKHWAKTYKATKLNTAVFEEHLHAAKSRLGHHFTQSLPAESFPKLDDDHSGGMRKHF